MACMFVVYDVMSKRSNVMSISDIHKSYPWVNLSMFRAEFLSIITIFRDGNKVAIATRVKEV